jgi:uncharacterized protein with gpF-like domain
MQDDELEELEKRLSALYASATKEVTDKFNEFTEEFAEQEARMLDLLALGKIDDDDFRIWRNNHILQSVRYQSLIKTLTDMMVNTDNSAMAIVSGELPFVIAQSYNFMQALGWDAANQAGYSAGTFTIYNASAVQALIRDNPDLLPSVNKPIDEAWNMSKITREITQGIIQGNTMPQIADRLRRVVGMDENTAMRNARTAFTYAENMGRNESINNLQSRGIPMEKVWSAVMDNRTRQTHRLLNGTTPDKATGLYGVGILAHPLRFPADKSGDAEEIYNCRCRLSGQLDSSIVDHSNDDELYEQFLRENYPNDYEALKQQDYFDKHSGNPARDIIPEEDDQKPSRFVEERGTSVPNSIEARAAQVRDMSGTEIRDIFVDNPDSYIYEPSYQSMTSERGQLVSREKELSEERRRLTEEIKNEQTVKPREEWTFEDQYENILGHKPMTYTERGEEIRTRLDDIWDEQKPIMSRLTEINGELDRIDNVNYVKQIRQWADSSHPLVRSSEGAEYVGFTTTMNISSFDADLKAGIGYIAEMSPSEYLDRIAYDIFDSTRERAISCNYANVKKYAEMMADGVKFDMGYLDYQNNGQEGRHRAMAAYLLGIEKIPVYIRGRR